MDGSIFKFNRDRNIIRKLQFRHFESCNLYMKRVHEISNRFNNPIKGIFNENVRL